MKPSVLLSLILSMIVAVASVQMAYSRGQMVSASWFELCSDGEVETVQLDPSGKPIPTSHPCPDCMIASGAALIPGVVSVLPVAGQGRTVEPVASIRPSPADLPERFARGPPNSNQVESQKLV